MSICTPVACAAIVEDNTWEKALARALSQIRTEPIDVLFIFISDLFAEDFPAIVRRAREETGARYLIGCSGQGVIGGEQELEDMPALSLLALSLPGAVLRPLRFTQETVERCSHPQDWRDHFNLPLDDVNAIILFTDPFSLDCEALIEGLARAYPGIPLLGGLASGDYGERQTHIFFDDTVSDSGGVGLAIGGDYTILPIVSQGCDPIGEPWTITRVRDDGLIHTISNRPAQALLIDTLEGLSSDQRRRTRHNLLVGLAADEYRDTFERGNFLIRQLAGIDRRTGGLIINALARVGQTIQFQVRDPATADLDLRDLLRYTRESLAGREPLAAILCTCNGRGLNLFGKPNHDAALIAREFGDLPLAGLFCNGEIGPIGNRSFLHGLAACVALFVRRVH